MIEFLVLLECLALGLLALVLVPNWTSDKSLELVSLPVAGLALLIYLYI